MTEEPKFVINGRKPKKIGVVVVAFDEDGAITEGEAELEAPRFPLISEANFRTACLIAFRNAGGSSTHQ